MGTKKHKKQNRHGRTIETQSPPLHIFHSLISSIQSPLGLKAANMKKMHAILAHLSSNGCMSLSGCESAQSFGSLVKLYGKDIRDFSDILFCELDSGFKQFFSTLHDVSANWSNGLAIEHVDVGSRIEELNLLLRCCMLLLVLIAFDQNLLLEKGRVLLYILSRLTSIELSGKNEKHSVAFKKLVSRECSYVNSDGTSCVTEEFVASIRLLGPSNPCCAYLCTVLEVFADELLVHKSLREYLILIDSASPRSEMLFTCHFDHGTIGSVLEVICAHFILSVSDEQVFENFLNRLFWCHGEEFRTPEISLSATLSLFFNSIISSGPKIFQGYLILLVSDAIGISMPSENRRDFIPVHYYTRAFESSIILYTRYMTGLHVNDKTLSGNGSFVKLCFLEGSGQLTSDSFLRPTTSNKLDHLICRLNNSWDLYSNEISSGTKSDLVASSIIYVKESLHIFNESYRDESLSIMRFIILRASSDDVGDMISNENGNLSIQNLFLLAATLKLMSSSMFQAVWYLRHYKFLGCAESLADDSSHRVYEALVNVIHCFEQFSIHLPVQKFLCQVMKSYPTRHKESKWMFLHFSGLLSIGYVSGLDFLVKDCLFTLMSLLDFFIVEEGDFCALGSLLTGSESFSSESPDGVEGVLVVQKTRPKTRKIQEMYLRTRSLISTHKRRPENEEILEYATVLKGIDSAHSIVAGSEKTCKGEIGVDTAISIVNNSENTCDGETFLKCILGKHSRSDVDDLADFIECRQGKDYSGWLRSRQRFREWKNKKTSLRWRRRKRAWSYAKGR